MKYILSGLILTAVLAAGQAPAAQPITYIATSDNVSSAGDAIRLVVLRWSTDAERDSLVKAWTNPTAPPAAAGGGRGGRGGGGGRGGAVAAADDGTGGADAGAGDAAAAPPAAAAGGGRGGGRGGRGGGGAAAAPARVTPESSLNTAIAAAPTVGYLWSSEVTGYAIRYAVKLPEQGGASRVVLLLDRKLGESNQMWRPKSDPPAAYEFGAVELHLNAKDEGEGKGTLHGKLTVDAAAKSFALENYASLPVLLKGVKRKAN